MANNNELQTQSLVRKLLLILVTGLFSVVMLGVVLYLQHKQSALSADLYQRAAWLSVCLGAGLLVAVFRLDRLRFSIRHCYLRGKRAFMQQSGSMVKHANGLLFSTLVMALLVSSETGGMQTQQFFFLSLLSALTGLMLARVWNGIITGKVEA